VIPKFPRTAKRLFSNTFGALRAWAIL
jgi:hypothetical protein